MRPLSELINNEEPAWPTVLQWVAEAAVPVEVLPAERAAAEAALYATQVTTRSPMGAIVYNSAGIFIDGGWLRVLGAGGHTRLQRSLPGWNEGRADGFYLIADDVLGGFFAINGGALGEDVGAIYYYAPDALSWESCEMGYSDFFVWALSGKLDEFYSTFRWRDWHEEVGSITGDQVIGVYPFLFTESTPIGERFRRPVQVAEQYYLQLDMQRQLGW